MWNECWLFNEEKEIKKWVVMNISNKKWILMFIWMWLHLMVIFSNEQLECCVFDVVYLKKRENNALWVWTKKQYDQKYNSLFYSFIEFHCIKVKEIFTEKCVKRTSSTEKMNFKKKLKRKEKELFNKKLKSTHSRDRWIHSTTVLHRAI